MTRTGMKPEDLIGSKSQPKAAVNKAILQHFRVTMNSNSQGKSKINYFLEGKSTWEPGKRPQYMSELTRKQTSLIFKARTRMIKVKSNYKNGHTDLICRMCKKEEETQKHILEECLAIHKDEAIIVPKDKIFSEETGTLKKTWLVT